MNAKRYVIAGLAVYLIAFIIDILVHKVILAGAYEATASVWRKDGTSAMWVLVPVVLIVAFAFTFMFVKGYEGKGIMEGVRFGAVAGVFISFATSYGQYVMLPIPHSLALKWLVLGLIQSILMGITAAAIYRPKKA